MVQVIKAFIVKIHFSFFGLNIMDPDPHSAYFYSDPHHWNKKVPRLKIGFKDNVT